MNDLVRALPRPVPVSHPGRRFHVVASVILAVMLFPALGSLGVPWTGLAWSVYFRTYWLALGF